MGRDLPGLLSSHGFAGSTAVLEMCNTMLTQSAPGAWTPIRMPCQPEAYCVTLRYQGFSGAL